MSRISGNDLFRGSGAEQEDTTDCTLGKRNHVKPPQPARHLLLATAPPQPFAKPDNPAYYYGSRAEC
jgi:hypothetical protein